MTEHLELDGVQWQRVSRKQVWVELAGLAILLVPLAVGGYFVVQWWASPWNWLAVGAAAAALIAAVLVTPRRVRAIGFRLREDDLLMRRGILFQRFVAVPYGRMQMIDVTRSPVARMLGLSTLKFLTASPGAVVLIPGLAEADADRLRDELVELAESRRAGL